VVFGLGGLFKVLSQPVYVLLASAIPQQFGNRGEPLFLSPSISSHCGSWLVRPDAPAYHERAGALPVTRSTSVRAPIS
jgi:hypothetical protein